MTRQPRCGFDVGSLRVSKPVSQGLKLGTGSRRVGGDGGPGWPIGLAADCSQGGVYGNGTLGRSGHSRSVRTDPYLSTNHHRRTLPISSANSTKTATRTAMNSSFVSLCAATSFWYALSSS